MEKSHGIKTCRRNQEIFTRGNGKVTRPMVHGILTNVAEFLGAMTLQSGGGAIVAQHGDHHFEFCPSPLGD
jgi:hypothetical protein